jgi:hypothetical protein
MRSRALKIATVSVVSGGFLLLGGGLAQASASTATPSSTAQSVTTNTDTPARPLIWATYGWYSSQSACEFTGREFVNNGTARDHYCEHEGVSGPNPWRLELDYI